MDIESFRAVVKTKLQDTFDVVINDIIETYINIIKALPSELTSEQKEQVEQLMKKHIESVTENMKKQYKSAVEEVKKNGR